ncbi:30272_t:CDS:2 [Racocetra persica]|uniref:30272_t:CDS:1 n=1 Tax=Racocetra persica TaxID=160502 RepID=A0ACA9KCJ9_9GLOM|nr:30272_t:CDS:2 [Racocetra persica]
MALDDENDFNSFIIESKNLSSNKIMNARGATVEVPPSYPVFGMAYAIKVNKQLNISQPISSISDLVSTLHEEKLTINGIKDLNNEYLKEELGVTKHRWLINIKQAASKY